MSSNQGSEKYLVSKHGLLSDSRINAITRGLPLWFGWRNNSVTVPRELAPYMVGRFFVSTKQVPSGLSLKSSGSSTIRRVQKVLLKAGATLEEVAHDGSKSNVVWRTIRTVAQTDSGSLASDLLRPGIVADLVDDYESDGSDTDDESSAESADGDDVISDTPPILGMKMRKPHLRLKYDDPWLIYAAAVLASKQKKTLPEIIVVSGDGYRLQDQLPTRLMGSRWKSTSRNRIRWSEVASHEVKTDVIRQHTHWGYALASMATDKDNESRSWAVNLRKRINRFIAGGPDPFWSEREQEIYWTTKESRPSKSRCERLIEVLKTIDGMFTQRYLSFPEEVWTWHKYDMFVLTGLSHLLCDEFLDGEVSEHCLDINTFYSQLKAARKAFKSMANRRRLKEEMDDVLNEMHPWLIHHFKPLWEEVAMATGGRYVFLSGMLSQTRGAGTPPPLVLLQSKAKFLRTVTEKPQQMTPTSRVLIKAALESVLDELPQEAFTGLSTKARITVATSASWEKTRKEGGTIQQIKEMICGEDRFDQVPVRDLDTNQVVSWKHMCDFDTPGEYIFWLSLANVLSMTPEQLRVAFLTVVKEPGKGRSVTKARACLKIVLDLVSKICAWPMKKGIRSSRSGMGQSHHGWNFFLRMMSEEMKDDLFKVASREESMYAGYAERVDTYEDLYLSSTDYKEATDRMPHDFAAPAAEAWMTKCGIPKVLKGIVHATCFRPRVIVFNGSGALANIGVPAPSYGQFARAVMMYKGVLMGDPLTKTVLHLSNIVSRRIGERIHQPDFVRRHPESILGTTAYLAKVS